MYRLISRLVKTMLMNGEIAPMLVWHAWLVPGRCDIMMDANQNGIYSAATDELDSGSPGFVVVTGAPHTPASVPALAPSGLITLIGLVLSGCSGLEEGLTNPILSFIESTTVTRQD